jgi:hypothetical protein
VHKKIAHQSFTEITNQNLEEILVLVICVIIPKICTPLSASFTRLSHCRTTPASETKFHPPRNWRSYFLRENKKKGGEELGQVVGKLSLQGKGTKQKNHLFIPRFRVQFFLILLKISQTVLLMEAHHISQ